MKDPKRAHPFIWLEVSNIAFLSGQPYLAVQIKGDEDSQRSFKFRPTSSLKDLIEAVKDKRPIHAKMVARNGEIVIDDLRIVLMPARPS